MSIYELNIYKMPTHASRKDAELFVTDFFVVENLVTAVLLMQREPRVHTYSDTTPSQQPLSSPLPSPAPPRSPHRPILSPETVATSAAKCASPKPICRLHRRNRCLSTPGPISPPKGLSPQAAVPPRRRRGSERGRAAENDNGDPSPSERRETGADRILL